MNIKPRAGVRRTLDAEWKAFRAEAARQKAEWDEEQKTKKFLEWLSQGDKMKINIDYEERGNDIQLNNMEIVTDSKHDSKIEIYMLDAQGTRVEGGTFSKDAFMILVRNFYDANF